MADVSSAIAALKIKPVNCPVCDRKVEAEPCEPWNKINGPQPWHCGCYHTTPVEHYVGVNGDTEADAIRSFNAEASKVRRKDFESPPTQFPR